MASVWVRLTTSNAAGTRPRDQLLATLQLPVVSDQLSVLTARDSSGAAAVAARISAIFFPLTRVARLVFVLILASRLVNDMSENPASAGGIRYRLLKLGF